MLEIGPNLTKAIHDVSGDAAGVAIMAILAFTIYKLLTRGY
jgi:hypothetical protein